MSDKALLDSMTATVRDAIAEHAAGSGYHDLPTWIAVSLLSQFEVAALATAAK